MDNEKKLKRAELNDENLSNVNGGMSEATANQIIELDKQINGNPTPEQKQQLQRLCVLGEIEPTTSKTVNIKMAWEILHKYGV